MLTVATIALFGMAQFASVVYRLRQRTATILTRMHDATGFVGDGDNLLSTARTLCEHVNKFEKQNRCDCLTLCAYLDAVVPLLYGNFLLVMVHLPNAKYHAELVGVTPENIGNKVTSIFIYFVVEFVLLGLLALLIYRNLGIRSVYQLAFVLETQWKQIQAKMF
ncbi:hypothetical protein BBP00_00009302, partial [Phytophthora kernoviae]